MQCIWLVPTQGSNILRAHAKQKTQENPIPDKGALCASQNDQTPSTHTKAVSFLPKPSRLISLRVLALGYSTGATAAPGATLRQRHVITGNCMDHQAAISGLHAYLHSAGWGVYIPQQHVCALHTCSCSAHCLQLPILIHPRFQGRK